MLILNRAIKRPQVLFLLVYLLLFVRFMPAGIDAGDAAYKLRQTADLIANAREWQPGDPLALLFRARYPGQPIDPAFAYFPAVFPFVKDTGRIHGYVFPFQIGLVFAPFLHWAGVAGVFALSWLAALGTLFFVQWMIAALDTPWPVATLALWAAAFGIGIPAYGHMASEHMLTCFLSTWAAYWLLFRPDHPWRLLGAGTLLGLASALRAETILLGPLFALGQLVIQRPRAKQWLFTTGVLGATMMVWFALLTWQNIAVTGNTAGFRGIGYEFFAVGSGGLTRLWMYWLGRVGQGTLLLETPLMFGIFPAIVYAWFRRAEPAGRAILGLAVVAVVYSILVPILVTIPPAGQYGERYLFNVYPLFAVVAGVWIQWIDARSLRRAAMGLAILTTLYAARSTWRHLDRAHRYNRVLAQTQAETLLGIGRERVVILRNSTLNTFFFFDPDPQRAYFLAEDDQTFLTLTEKLNQSGIYRFAVLHTRLRGRGWVSDQGDTFDLADHLVPADLRYKVEGPDLGGRFLELRIYDL